MREHREPPPSVADGPTIPMSAPEQRALPPPGRGPRVRVRLHRSWLWVASALVLVGLLAVYAAVRVSTATRGWLADQSAYRIPFGAIVLDPPPPSWFRGGTSAFLEDVRLRARMPETIAVLNLQEGELRRVFEANSPWVERVESVAYRPLGLAVRIVYQRPVALVLTARGRSYLVNASGVILPKDDLNTDVKQFVVDQGLIQIDGPRITDPTNPRPGLVWQPRPGAADAAPGNARIPAAARLAGFLLDRMRLIDRRREPALRIDFINPMDPEGRGLFLINAERRNILWGAAPGEEPPGSLTAEEKWEKLREWSKEVRDVDEGDGGYWEITSTRVIPRPWTGTMSSHRGRRDAAVLDREAIPAKAPGQSGRSMSH